MTMKVLDCQLKLMALMMHRHADSGSCWNYSDSGPYRDSNITSENETYAAHLIFKQ